MGKWQDVQERARQAGENIAGNQTNREPNSGWIISNATQQTGGQLNIVTSTERAVKAVG